MRLTLPSRLDWRLILVVWVLAVVWFIAREMLRSDIAPLTDTDDAMRMVTALDLLNGQPWTNLVQHRSDPPTGTLMHWSRLVDAPIALLMLLARPVLGTAGAADFASIAWPSLLLLPFLWLSALLIRALVPATHAIAALVLPLIGVVLASEFSPGRVDHHNLQIVLCLAAALALVTVRHRIRGAIVTGLAVATSLAIGMETLPAALAISACYGMSWIIAPQAQRVPLAAYGLWLTASALGHFLLATDPANYLMRACDMLSVVYLVGIGLGAAALLIAVLIQPKQLWVRVVLLGALGALAVIVTAFLFPNCLHGAYADLAPRLVADYLDPIVEMQPLWQRVVDSPAGSIPVVLTTLIGVPVSLWRAWAERGEARARWLIILCILVVTAAVIFAQTRGVRIAAPFALPAAAYLVTAAARRSWQLAVLAWVGLASYPQILVTVVITALVVPANPFAGEQAERTCLMPDVFKELAALPAGQVMTPIMLGARTLYHTHHSVTTAGFHRDGKGIADSIDFFAGDEPTARRIATERHLDYVVTCGPMSPQWAWLTPISAPDARLQIYAVRP